MASLGQFTKTSCTRCPETDRSKFPIDKRRPNGIGPWCISCKNAYVRSKSASPEGRRKRNAYLKARRIYSQAADSLTPAALFSGDPMTPTLH